MGWSGGYRIFDDIVGKVVKLKIEEKDKVKIIQATFESLKENDWDTECDSNLIYNKHPIVVKALGKKYPWLFDHE